MTLTPEEMEALKTVINYLCFVNFVLGFSIGIIVGLFIGLKPKGKGGAS